MSTDPVTLVGYGWHLVPRIPFELGRLASGDAVVVHHQRPALPKLRLGTARGRVEVTLGPGTTRAEDVLVDFYDAQPLPAPGWSLACRGYLMPWPEGTSVWSAGPPGNWPVELTLAGAAQKDEMLYVQGPFDRASAPVLDRLVGAGMELVGRAELTGVHGAVDAIELRYAHEGSEWRQWRYLAPLADDLVVLVTAQASAARYAVMLALGKTIAQGVRC